MFQLSFWSRFSRNIRSKSSKVVVDVDQHLYEIAQLQKDVGMVRPRLRKIAKDGRKGREAGPLGAHFAPISDVETNFQDYMRPDKGGDEGGMLPEADDDDKHELTDLSICMSAASCKYSSRRGDDDSIIDVEIASHISNIIEEDRAKRQPGIREGRVEGDQRIRRSETYFLFLKTSP